MAAVPARNPVALTLAVLRESYLHSLEVLASDRAVAGPRDFAETPEDDRYDDAYYSRLFEREATRVRSRLAASASAAGSLWLAAWEEAGRPALDPRFRLPYVRGQSRAVLLSLDGAGAEVIDDAVARGLMPRLAALRARGASARGSISALPTKTAPGHAALFTGAWGDRNGIVGNEVPVPGGSVLETQTGYSSTPLTAEPIWYAAARQDLDAVVVSGTQVFPFTTYTEDRRFRGYTGRRLTLFDGYQNLDGEDGVITEATLAWKPAGPALTAAARARGRSARSGLRAGRVADRRLDVRRSRRPRGRVRHRAPGPGRRPVGGGRAQGDAAAGRARRVPRAHRPPGRRRVHALLPPVRAQPPTDRGSRSTTRRRTCCARASRGWRRRRRRRRAGSSATAPRWSYEQGRLGPQLWQGGDGTAEARYVETIALVTRQFARLNDFAFERTPWDLLVTYLPFPDEALHRWYGRARSRAARSRPAARAPPAARTSTACCAIVDALRRPARRPRGHATPSSPSPPTTG